MYNVTLREGDIVIIHTGWGDLFEQFPAQNALYNSGEPGIGKDAANWLVSQKVVAVGADTWAVEVIPGENPEGSLHRPQHPAHRQRHPHHRERAHRPDGRRGGGDQARHVLLHHDGAQGRRHDRQLRRDRRHPARRRGRGAVKQLDAGAPRGAPASSCPSVGVPARWSPALLAAWRRGAGLSAAALHRRLRQRSPRSPASRSRAPASPGAEVRESFVLAARQHADRPRLLRQPARRRRGAVANAEAAIARKVDLYIQYHRGFRRQRRRRAEAEGRGHSRARGQLPRAGRAALQRRTTRRPDASPARRSASSPRAPGRGSRRSRSSSAACRTPGRPRARAGAGRDRGAAQAPARACG